MRLDQSGHSTDTGVVDISLHLDAHHQTPVATREDVARTGLGVSAGALLEMAHNAISAGFVPLYMTVHGHLLLFASCTYCLSIRIHCSHYRALLPAGQWIMSTPSYNGSSRHLRGDAFKASAHFFIPGFPIQRSAIPRMWLRTADRCTSEE